ncbi:hypothetical protein Q9L58_001203 [Maublancomyces gigas]|uniref:J domain-containing protein n=1 Tax=Discina gigas TaxID=1032678 RepID=A0ABR3GUX2_9PEZI
MPSTEADAASYATTSSTDFYEILGIPLTETSPTLLRKAFRKQSLKWHPDKNPDPSAAETFHLLSIAYDVLSDPGTRAAYDNARNARLAKKRRHEAFDLNRRRMQEDLERREGQAKRTRTDADDAEDAFRRQMSKLQAEGATLRHKREEALRTAAKEAEAAESNGDGGGEEDAVAAATAPAAAAVRGGAVGKSRFSELDRTLRVRWKRRNNDAITAAHLRTLFSRFGPVQDCVVPSDSPKPGSKEKKLKTALLVFESIVAAHAAVHAAQGSDNKDFNAFKDIVWAGGEEPDISHDGPAPKTTTTTPSFGSFSSAKKTEDADYESITLMRMRAAEKARIEVEIRKQDEQDEEEEGVR